MQIEDVIAAGDLIEVKGVKSPAKRVRGLGNAKTQSLYRRDMTTWFCYENALALVDAMREAAELDWHVVYGVGIGYDPIAPHAHVWVRRGVQHFDPTWGQPARCHYYALSEKHVAVNTLAEVGKLMNLWKIGYEDVPDQQIAAADEEITEEQERLLMELVAEHEGRKKE